MATDEAIEQRLGEDPEDESVKERLEREHGELLEELRALIPGAEVLFGFRLASRLRASSASWTMSSAPSTKGRSSARRSRSSSSSPLLHITGSGSGRTTRRTCCGR